MHQHKCANKRQFSTDGIDKRNTCGNTFENYNLERGGDEACLIYLWQQTAAI